jgi:phosphoenolpyruvate carboxykinase (ATP)
MNNSDIGSQLEAFGIRSAGAILYNGSPARLVEEAIRREEGYLTAGGPFLAYTGQHTGRSPNDKFVVRESSSADKVWWGTVNREFEQEKFDGLLAKAKEYLSNRDLFVADCYVGADPRYRLGVRVINMHAWHNLFAQTLFIPLSKTEPTLPSTARGAAPSCCSTSGRS